MQEFPIYQDIILVGGGHAHAMVLQMWAMNPLPGARLTLVSPQVQTTYSGMLPGLVAGHYRLDEAHIDLVRLCRAAGARFIQACAHHIDADAQRISLLGRPDLEYDVLSLDVGATPARDLPGSELAIPVKPIGHFHRYWQQLQNRVRGSRANLKLGVVGGGAGGCELAMAMAHALEEQVYSGRVQLHLIHGGRHLPEGYPLPARMLVARELRRLRVQVHRDWPVAAIEEGGVRCEDGRTLALDQVLLTTNACAPPWLADSGLALDGRGFVVVDDQLRARGRDNVFATGDVASFASRPLPKAGVYAVRQGPVLYHNLRAALTGARSKCYRPQRHFLSLLSCGGQRAVAVRNGFALAGGALWRWKNHIDRTFMRRFSELPVPRKDTAQRGFFARHRAVVDDHNDVSLQAERDNGCAVQIGAEVLRSAQAKQPAPRSGVLLRSAGGDAAVMELPAGKLLVQSSDQLRTPIEDPWIFGRLAALHALSNLFAMHASPITAQALVTQPPAAPDIARRDLQQLLDGAAHEFNRHHCALCGGHTAAGAEMHLGFTVNGLAEAGQILEKTGARAGDCLFLTKPLGIGILLAAERLGEARGRWVQKALETMLQSNAGAAELCIQHDARALANISSLGLLGHLLEMLGAELAATLIVERLPLLPGAAYCAERSCFSNLQAQNANFYQQVRNPLEWRDLPQWPLLTDPQTCGGLLAAIPPERAKDCLIALQHAGAGQAAIVGVIEPLDSDRQPPVRLLRSADWRTLVGAHTETVQFP